MVVHTLGTYAQPNSMISNHRRKKQIRKHNSKPISFLTYDKKNNQSNEVLVHRMDTCVHLMDCTKSTGHSRQGKRTKERKKKSNGLPGPH
jgi:hypothetical protein